MATREVQKTITETVFICDICGSEKVARYSCNRTCEICGRIVCQEHVSESEPLDDSIMCVPCYSLREVYQPRLNQAWTEHENMRKALKSAWKEHSTMQSKGRGDD
jgi:hypothetical protein